MLNKIDQMNISITKNNQNGQNGYFEQMNSINVKSPEKKTSAEEQGTTYSAFDRKIVGQNQPYIPRSVAVAGAESIYHEQVKEIDKKATENIVVIPQDNVQQSIL